MTAVAVKPPPDSGTLKCTHVDSTTVPVVCRPLLVLLPGGLPFLLMPCASCCCNSASRWAAICSCMMTRHILTVKSTIHGCDVMPCAPSCCSSASCYWPAICLQRDRVYGVAVISYVPSMQCTMQACGMLKSCRPLSNANNGSRIIHVYRLVPWFLRCNTQPHPTAVPHSFNADQHWHLPKHNNPDNCITCRATFAVQAAGMMPPQPQPCLVSMVLFHKRIAHMLKQPYVIYLPLQDHVQCYFLLCTR